MTKKKSRSKSPLLSTPILILVISLALALGYLSIRPKQQATINLIDSPITLTDGPTTLTGTLQKDGELDTYYLVLGSGQLIELDLADNLDVLQNTTVTVSGNLNTFPQENLLPYLEVTKLTSN